MSKFSYSSLRGSANRRRRRNLFIQKSVIRNRYSVLPPGQKGQSSIYVIILIIVIIFAVMLSGGSGSLFSGNLPSFVIDPTETPEPGTPTPASTTSEWKIEYTKKACNSGQAEVEIIATGKENGYLSIETSSGTIYSVDYTDKFNAPDDGWQGKLSPKCSTSACKIKLYSGGSISGGVWSGGDEKVAKEIPAAGC